MTSGWQRYGPGQLVFADFQDRRGLCLVRQGRTGHNWFLISTGCSTNALFLLSFLCSFLSDTQFPLFSHHKRLGQVFISPSPSLSCFVISHSAFSISTFNTQHTSPTKICRRVQNGLKSCRDKEDDNSSGCAKSWFCPQNKNKHIEIRSGSNCE